MRPVNLIPPEERRGEKAPLRSGPLGYIIVAVLAVVLLGVTLVVMTDNQIADRKSEKASVEAEVSQTQAQAQVLSTYADFASLQLARQETVSSLATSRFDWERVLRELAIVIPNDVWLTNLQASASGAASASSSDTGSASATGSILGPSLQIQGCAAGHDAVARFLASLRDVDGITRVAVMSSDGQSASSSASQGSASSSDGGGTGPSCSSRGFISSFQVVAAFDAAQVGASPSTAAAPPTTATTTSTTQPSSDSSTTTATTDQSQVADAQQELQQQKDSAAQKTAQGRKAVGTFIPGAGSAP